MRILVAEDDAQILGLLHRFLSSFGHEVLTALDGEIASQILRETEGVRLLITDYNMPRMNGAALCRQARATHDASRLRIVLMSGTVDGTVDLSRIGADAFLPKPFRAQAVQREVALAEQLQASTPGGMGVVTKGS